MTTPISCAESVEQGAGRIDRDTAFQREMVTCVVNELARRHPEQDWDRDPLCYRCGSMKHFEC